MYGHGHFFYLFQYILPTARRGETFISFLISLLSQDFNPVPALKLADRTIILAWPLLSQALHLWYRPYKKLARE